MEDPKQVLKEAENIIGRLCGIIEELEKENEQLRKQLGLGTRDSPMNVTVDDLDCSVRTYNRIAFLENVRGILKYQDWKSIKGFGTKSAQEVCQKLEGLGLKDKIPKPLADMAKWKL